MNNSGFFNSSQRANSERRDSATRQYSKNGNSPEDNAERFANFVDYYAVLECDPNAERDEVKKNYRKLILDWHPDKRPDSPTKQGSKMFQMINDAWDILKDEEKRAEYTALWREYKKTKLMPFERAELARKEGNEMYKKGQIAARDNNIPQALSFYQQAIDRYSDGINIGTDDHRLHSNRALCYAVLRDWPRAKKDAQRVVEIRPTFMKGWFTLVRAHIMEYNLEKAEQDLIRGLEQCNNHQDLVKLKEEIGQKREQMAQAQQNRYNEQGSNPNSARNPLGSSQRNRSPRDANGDSVNRMYSGRNVTPSHTPPTPIQLSASGVYGQSYRNRMGGTAAERGVSPGWGVDLEQTRNQMNNTLIEQRMYDLEGTAAFGRSIGYSRTPERGRSPRTGGTPPPPPNPLGQSSTRGFGNGTGTPPRYHTPPRHATPPGFDANQTYSARPAYLDHTVDFGTPNPLNQSYGYQLNQSSTQHMGYPPSVRRRESHSRSPIQGGRSPVTTPPRPMRPPSLAGQAQSARPRMMGGSASEPRLVTQQ